MSSPGSSPGGPKLSGTKRRRLALLEDSTSTKPETSRGTAAAKKHAIAQSTRQIHQPKKPSSQINAAPYDSLDSILTGSPLSSVLKLHEAGRPGKTVEDLLSPPAHVGQSPDALQEAITLKVADRTIMLDNPATASSGKNKGVHRQNRLISRKASKRLGLFDITSHKHLRFDMFDALQDRWRQYIKELTSSQTGLEDRLLLADLHGCLIRVDTAKQAGFTGREGVIIKSTLNMFWIISKDDRIASIPKAGTIFSYKYTASKRIVLNGSKLATFGM